MAYFMSTPLGRDVPLGDWASYREDQILKLLLDFHMNPFNDGTLKLSLASICSATGLSEADAADAASRLVAKEFAAADGKSYAITPAGLIFVGMLARNPLTGSL